MPCTFVNDVRPENQKIIGSYSVTVMWVSRKREGETERSGGTTEGNLRRVSERPICGASRLEISNRVSTSECYLNGTDTVSSAFAGHGRSKDVVVKPLLIISAASLDLPVMPRSPRADQLVLCGICCKTRPRDECGLFWKGVWIPRRYLFAGYPEHSRKTQWHVWRSRPWRSCFVLHMHR